MSREQAPSLAEEVPWLDHTEALDDLIAGQRSGVEPPERNQVDEVAFSRESIREFFAKRRQARASAQSEPAHLY